MKSFINKKIDYMKKFLLVLAIGAFAACNGSSTDTKTADTAAAAAKDTSAMKADTTKKDTSAIKADTTKKDTSAVKK